MTEINLEADRRQSLHRDTDYRARAETERAWTNCTIMSRLNLTFCGGYQMFGSPSARLQTASVVAAQLATTDSNNARVVDRAFQLADELLEREELLEKRAYDLKRKKELLAAQAQKLVFDDPEVSAARTAVVDLELQNDGRQPPTYYDQIEAAKKVHSALRAVRLDSIFQRLCAEAGV